ncbi:MAG TPA: glycosyltransferase [Actinomycetota bacterium]
MRILVWHGWILEGSGSNVYTARIVEAWRARGHDVLLVAQERHPERFAFLDAWADGNLTEPHPTGVEPSLGRATLLRPDIGDLLPVFVWDAYEGFRVKTFVDLSDEELEGYLDRNVAALREAAEAHGTDVAIAGHAIPGANVARRALGSIPFAAKIHGSDVEYAMRGQRRYVELAREGLEGAVVIAGASRDVLDRLIELVPSVAGRTKVVPPGVEVERFHPMPRAEALRGAASLLERDPALARGRPETAASDVAEALRRRDGDALDRLANTYEQTSPDRDAPRRLRALAGYDGPLVGYLGKLIPQKGVHDLLAALALLPSRPRALVVGFGTFREWLEALVAALDAGDPVAAAFLEERMPLGLSPGEVAAAAGLAERVVFTGRLDHRYAGPAAAALDVLVVPSILEEAFGMVALEGAAAGALPLVARHSGLAEVADALETEIGRPGLLSYEPGLSAPRALGRALEGLLALPDRRELAAHLSSHVRERWSWGRTADLLLEPLR